MDAPGTVHVAAGTYNENVSVTKANVSFIGPNAGTSGVGSRVAEAIVNGYVKVSANGATFDGFKIIEGASVPAGELAGLYIIGGLNGITVH